MMVIIYLVFAILGEVLLWLALRRITSATPRANTITTFIALAMFTLLVVIVDSTSYILFHW